MRFAVRRLLPPFKSTQVIQAEHGCPAHLTVEIMKQVITHPPTFCPEQQVFLLILKLVQLVWENEGPRYRNAPPVGSVVCSFE
ncbi:hypothetical protein DPMN_135360 [Dreissena polymorpha]|uniref:Uncharacterized protein n=1 Tax=Dreissena polymorpha TaxID=45954 RepID=A0A9D4G1P9_DREPO|nr:hypothetical protein DPMN_135360 [Dreissena polymorpha]